MILIFISNCTLFIKFKWIPNLSINGKIIPLKLRLNIILVAIENYVDGKKSKAFRLKKMDKIQIFFKK